MKPGILSGILCLSLLCTISGCMTAGRHSSQLHSERERQMTVGIVQKEIREGMSQADVAAALGSPNIVTKDAEGQEAWIYDKIATDAAYAKVAAVPGFTDTHAALKALAAELTAP